MRISQSRSKLNFPSAIRLKLGNRSGLGCYIDVPKDGIDPNTSTYIVGINVNERFDFTGIPPENRISGRDKLAEKSTLVKGVRVYPQRITDDLRDDSRGPIDWNASYPTPTVFGHENICAGDSKTDRIIEPGEKGSPIPGAVIAVNNTTDWTAVSRVCHIKIGGHCRVGLRKDDALGANEIGSKGRRRPIRSISND